MKHILATIPLTMEQQDRLEQIAAGPDREEVSLIRKVFGEVTREDVAQANLIIGRIPPAMIGASENLDLLQLDVAGVDPYIVPGVLSDRTVLCNATGAYGKAVSEHAAALTMMLLKKLYLYRDAQSLREWSDFGTVRSPQDMTVLVVGLGDIGTSYGRIMKALGAKVIGVKRRPGPCPEGIDELVLTEEIDRVLPQADIIFSILPSTKDTVHFYTEERFALMKPGALFVNCGRGNVVDGEVLLRALTGGQIEAGTASLRQPALEPEKSGDHAACCRQRPHALYPGDHPRNRL